MTPAYEFKGSNHRRHDVLQAWTEKRQEKILEPQLPIVDPHHHVWDDQRGRYLIDELSRDIHSGHNVVATVFIEAGAMYRAQGPKAMRPVGEVEFVNGIAAMSASGQYGLARLCDGIVGHADLMLGSQAEPVLEALIKAGNGRFKGIRHGVIWDSGNAARFGRRQATRYQMLDPIFRQGFSLLEPMGLSFDAWLFYPQLDDLKDLLKAFPHTAVILNHVGGLLGIPPHDEDRKSVFKRWRSHIQALASYDNLKIKVGGLGMLYCGWDFHLQELPPTSEQLAEAWRPYVETCIEAFGFDRCIMESNFPVDKETCGYVTLWNALKRITKDCSSDEKNKLYSQNAAQFYRLNLS